MRDLAEEESDAMQFDDVARPYETNWPSWSGFVCRAWRDLRDDRHYGSMGGMGRIYYSSISKYADDNGIKLYPFLAYIQALDDVWIKWNAEKPKQEEQKTDGG